MLRLRRGKDVEQTLKTQVQGKSRESRREILRGPCLWCRGCSGARQSTPFLTRKTAQLTVITCARGSDFHITTPAKRIDLARAIDLAIDAMGAQMNRPRRELGFGEASRPIHVPVNKKRSRILRDDVKQVRAVGFGQLLLGPGFRFAGRDWLVAKLETTRAACRFGAFRMLVHWFRSGDWINTGSIFHRQGESSAPASAGAMAFSG